MFQDLGLTGWTPQSAAVLLGLVLGLAFGFLAERSRFCLRRGLAGDSDERSSALGVWAIALAVAIAGTTAAGISGLIDLGQHRFLSGRLPLAAIVFGGLLFGAGMVLARGCASRLTVLSGTGNLRAMACLLVFAIMAHATTKGALSPARAWLGSFSVELGSPGSLAALPGGPAIWAAAIGGALLAFAFASRARLTELGFGAAIGALVPLGWLGTGLLLRDEFDPIPLESLAFTSAATEGLFWWVAGTAVAPTFSVGLLLGVVAGSFLSAAAGRRLSLVGFESGAPTGRYLAGASLMGVGGVLAGGCTVGAGLAGVSMLSIAAVIALAAMVAGAIATRILLAAQRPSLVLQAG